MKSTGEAIRFIKDLYDQRDVFHSPSPFGEGARRADEVFRNLYKKKSMMLSR